MYTTPHYHIEYIRSCKYRRGSDILPSSIKQRWNVFMRHSALIYQVMGPGNRFGGTDGDFTADIGGRMHRMLVSRCQYILLDSDSDWNIDNML